MTVTLRFRVDEKLAAALAAEAALSGVTRSDLVARATKELLYRLACERNAEIYGRLPITPEEAQPWPKEVWAEDDTDWAQVSGS